MSQVGFLLCFTNLVLEFPHPAEGDFDVLVAGNVEWLAVVAEDVAHAEGVASSDGVDAGTGVELEAYAARETIIKAVCYRVFGHGTSVVFNHIRYFRTEVEVEAEHPFAKGEMGEQRQFDVIELPALVAFGYLKAPLLVVQFYPEAEIFFEYHAVLQSCRNPYRH